MSKKWFFVVCLVMLVWASPVLTKERVRKIKLVGNHLFETSKSITVNDLEKLPMTEYSVVDPYSKEETGYKGVLLREFVSRFGTQEVVKITVRAIDEYVIHFNREEWTRWDILLATQKNGTHMDVQNGGPVRIVFPYHKSKDIDQVKYHPKWIWQIKQIEFFTNE
ncbi:MAG: molybdopterin-dependent oxidoreductase [SAR324 cluster bacterium]|nr:molybdopterin-dependent oxidoreductase [SAR324 cluster bacterium]